MTRPQDAEARIARILEDASTYLAHEGAAEVLAGAGRWRLFENLMRFARDLRAVRENPATVALLMTGKLAAQLRDLGVSERDLLSVVDSTFGPLVGPVLLAYQDAEAARREPAEAAAPAPDSGRTGPAIPGLPLVTIGALLEEPEEACRWIVDGILMAGGLSLLAAKPKAGKSTLARCLCVAVSQAGGTWLGREVQHGTAIYLGFEEKRAEVKRHFRALGAEGERLLVYVDLPPADAIDLLGESVAATQPALVVVDGLYRLVRVNDESGYAEVYAKLGPLLALARNSGAHVLMTHHEGKRANGQDGQDGVLGSTALVGSVDATLVIRRDRDSGRRTIRSTQRYGEDLEESVLEMDEGGHVTLGRTRAVAELAEAQDAILETLARSGPCPEKAGDGRDGLRSLVTGVRTGTLARALRQLMEAGRVTRTGNGRKGDPYLYNVPESGFSGSHLYAGTRKPESERDGAALGSVQP